MYCLTTILSCGTGAIRTFLNGLNNHSGEPLITIITFSIFPELTRLWYYFIERSAGLLTGHKFTLSFLIVDCSGKLDPRNFPIATIERFINDTHPHKLDFFFRRYIGSEFVLISDDDCFILNPQILVEAAKDLTKHRGLAAISFFPRPDWWLIVNNGRIRPMGSYCLMVNRNIILNEKLYFQSPKIINPHNHGIYDTADYMNEQLLKRGYGVNLPDEQQRSTAIGGFRGSSIWKALEWGCSKNELIKYFAKPFSYEYHLRHNLKSFYIAAKVMDLYSIVFREKIEPMFTDIELLDFFQTYPEGDLKDGIKQDLEWVDKSHRQLSEIINATKS